MGDTLLALTPLADLLLLLPVSGLPEGKRTGTGTVRVVHFALGLAAAFLAGGEPWRTAAAVVAGLAVAADLGLGAFSEVEGTRWSSDMKARQAAHEENTRRREEIQAEIGRLEPRP